MHRWSRFAVVAACTIAPILGLAQNSPADDEHKGPPPESIAACKDKSEGTACEFDGPHGHVAGSCKKMHTGDVACAHPHMHHDGGAPSTSIVASLDVSE